MESKLTSLVKFRKSLTTFLRDYNGRLNEENFKSTLQAFFKLTHAFTPDELVVQFKESAEFIQIISEIFVQEVKKRANNESTIEASRNVYEFIRPVKPDSFGWLILKSVGFLINGGQAKLVEPVCKATLPSTLAKIFYLFLDLPPNVESDEVGLRQMLYDTLVMLMCSLCSFECVAEELIQHDDMVLLFLGAATVCSPSLQMWRDANLTFICTILQRGVNESVIKYMHTKSTIMHYIRQLGNQTADEVQTATLWSNLLELLKVSMESSTILSDDFTTLEGFQKVVEFTTKASLENAVPVVDALVALIPAGNQAVNVSNPQTTLSFYPFNLSSKIVRTTRTVRVPRAFDALSQLFNLGNEELAKVVLEHVDAILKAERLNYFILDKESPISVLVEYMDGKSPDVQKKVLQIVENVLRDLNFIPCKELSAINKHLRTAIRDKKYVHIEMYLHFLFGILPANVHIKDAFRELLHLEAFLQLTLSAVERDIAQRGLDLLVTTTKGNALNAQFITENLDMKTIKNVLVDKTPVCTDFSSTMHTLVKNLLYLAKNEQLFSSLLQILFSDPGNLDNCMVLLRLFVSTLLESHKVRVMFRRSGGYICLMTLLLQLELALTETFDQEEPSENVVKTLKHISLIFHVLTVSMRFEPSNARYYYNEVKPTIVSSIMRATGAFSENKKINASAKIWTSLKNEFIQKKLWNIHQIFCTSDAINIKNYKDEIGMPTEIFSAMYIIKQLFDLGMDLYDKQATDIVWANNDWLSTVENVETIPVVTWTRSVLVHPTSVTCILQLLPSLERSYARQTGELDEWSAVAQYYTALLLKALLRPERNQQVMCEHNMPKRLLEVGDDLFKQEKHLLLPPFHYLFERLACQSMHPRELRHFLRLDKPLCCTNLDGTDDDGNNGGGPLPIHRVKALVSMLTPRNHVLVHPPSFVEFDMTIEGFASLFIPSLAYSMNSASSANTATERLFPPINGLTYMTWLYLDDIPKQMPVSPQPANQSYFGNIVRLFTIVRNTDKDVYSSGQKRSAVPKETAVLENHLACLYIHLDVAQKQLIVCTQEHSLLDELRRDYSVPPASENVARISLNDIQLATKQWIHLTITLSRSLLKPSQLELFVNGRLLATQKMAYISPNVGGAQAQIADTNSAHAFIGTPPFLRRVTSLRWRISSTYLVEDVLTAEQIRKIVALKPHYIGNFQCSLDNSPLIPEEKLILSLTASSKTEFTLQNLRAITRKVDTDLCSALMGLSPSDNSTPIRFLWNCCRHVQGPPRSLGGVVVGYLGMRTFSPSPVSSLLDSVGGAAPLLGLIAMCSDSHGLYASLKVLVSAVQTNRTVAEFIQRNRLYQTLAVLLDEKIHLVNSHILHLILSLAGTVDLSKEVTVIPCQQTFEDLLCDMQLWMGAPDDVKKLLFEHFYELVIDNHRDNLSKVRQTTILSRLLLMVTDRPDKFVICNDILFRLIGAIIQPPCDEQSLLRFGQAIASTLPTQSMNSGEKPAEISLPFHIAELEKILTNQCNRSQQSGQKVEVEDCGMDPVVYTVYVRNRLLNILTTTLAHTSKSTNSQLCESVVGALGFGWFMALSGPGVHRGTVYLALKTLLLVTKYPQLLQKFREGTANSGWLQDADSVLRNRAAVLLGFSVSAHGGAVGSHVDVNPELAQCSGFAAMEHLMCAHVDQPFAYLAVLALLFNQHDVNIQPLEEFNVDLIWSHVFSLSSNCSVYDVLSHVDYCPEALIPLVAMLRAGMHYESEIGADLSDSHWSRSYPLMVVQLIQFLYQNLENFVPFCHNETFVIALFTALVPPRASDLSPAVPQPSSPLSAFHSANQRCAKSILELIASILLNDLCLQYDEDRTDWLFDHLVEFLEGGGAMHSSQAALFTELVNTCLDHFMASDMFFSNSSVHVPKSIESHLSPSSEQTAVNVIHFLSKVIDSVWNCLYRGNPVKILKCFLKLLAEAHTSNKAAAQLTCTESHLNALFRILLYLLSRPIDNIDTQTSVVDTLAEIIRNQHILLSANSNNPLFYGALVHVVFMLCEPPDIQSSNKHLERGSAQVSVCAQSVWGILWQQKRKLLEEIFKHNVELDLYSARAACTDSANKYWLQFVDLQAQGGNPTGSGPPSASITASARQVSGQLQQQIQSRLSRVAKSGFKRLASTKSILGSSMSQDKPTFQPAVFFYDRPKVGPETFYMWIRVHVSLLRELLRTQQQRYKEWHAHVRKWCMQDWHVMESELTRERGLWGPEERSKLVKFQLDVTEGPCRIRKKLLPDNDFYHRYPYRPHLENVESKSIRAKYAVSKDSKEYYELMKKRRRHTMDDRIVDLCSPSANGKHSMSQTSADNMVLDSTTELNISMIKRMVIKNVTEEEQNRKLQESLQKEINDADEEENDSDNVDESLEESESREGCEKQGSRENNDASDGASESKAVSRKKSSHADSERHAMGNGPDNQTLLRLLEQGEQLHSMFRCARVQGLDTIEGLLLFGRQHFYVVDGFTLLKTREIRDLDFLPEQYHDPIVPYMAMGSQHRMSTRADRQCNKFAYDDIREVHKRRYLLQPIALEVFSADGRNYLLAFPRKIRDRVHQKLLSLSRTSSVDASKAVLEQKKLMQNEGGAAFFGQIFGQQSMTQRWVRGDVSNFTYLMYLNTMAGRTYNDLSQYPVFPWVLKDFDSEQLDLSQPSTFRDLSKPMGAQTPERLTQFLKRYREWDDPSGDTPPYMYGTHYSSAMIVLSYLVRLEPFTQQFLKLQGGHFDLADRMFHSVGDAFKSAARNNMADVKELIPEFFYLPDMFLNANAYDLGVKQNGTPLNDVVLPPWAHEDPIEFVRKHREALESDYVSEHLNDWIDLIFGYKQQGEAAKDAFNVFHHLFYEENVDFENIVDPLTRNATLGFINNFGQTPSQLFKKPHPQKKISAIVQGSTSITDRHQPQQMVQPVSGITTPTAFYHSLESLRPTLKPVKELRAAIGDIRVNEKNQVIVLEQNKMLVPPQSYMSWGFNDRSIRMGQVGNDKSTCILETNDTYEITCMETADGKTVFAGLTTGTVLVWTLSANERGEANTERGSVTHHSPSNMLTGAGGAAAGAAVAGVVSSAGQTVKQTMPGLATASTAAGSASSAAKRPRLRPKKALDAHTDVVTCLAACPAHNFMVSASRDHSAVIWHLTQLAYIRQLADHQSAVSAVAVNATSGDIATAAGANLHLWTLNGVPLTVVHTVESGLFSNASSLILSLAFSTLSDWDHRNVVMCGTSDGLVKIYTVELKKCALDTSASVADGTQKPANDPKAIKEHLLRRQQRIQSHHSHSSGSFRLSIDTQDSQCSSPLHTPSSSSNCDDSVDDAFEKSARNAETADTTEKFKWRRVCQLKRVLSEHTSYNHSENQRPAPITAMAASRDHKQLFVGDGAGRVWMWTMEHGGVTGGASVRMRAKPAISAPANRASVASMNSNSARSADADAPSADAHHSCAACRRPFAGGAQPRAVGLDGVAQTRRDCKNCGQWFCEK